MLRGKIRPDISRTWPLSELPLALQALVGRSVLGKAVVTSLWQAGTSMRLVLPDLDAPAALIFDPDDRLSDGEPRGVKSSSCRPSSMNPIMTTLTAPAN